MNNDQLMQAVANLIKVKGRHHTEQAYKQLVEAYDASLTAAQSAQERDWTEDFQHENGHYMCNCVKCGSQFFGHKRRVTCKACASLAKVEQEQKPRGWFVIEYADNGEECLTHTYKGDRGAFPLYAAPQAQQEAVKAAALLETIKEVRDHVVSAVRAFGEKACADYLDNWHKVEHIYAAMQASPAQADTQQCKGCEVCQQPSDCPFTTEAQQRKGSEE